MSDTTSDKIYCVRAVNRTESISNEHIKWLDEFGLNVSDQGRIFDEYFNEIKPHNCGKGYLRISHSVNKTRRFEYVHRLVLLAFVGPPPVKHEVNHINHIRNDNRLSNLEYVTSSQNTYHAVNAGRWATGENRWNARLNDELVLQIRKRYEVGEKYCSIADDLGLNRNTVYHVVKRHSWRHVA